MKSEISEYWIGVDVGGANLKIADVNGNADSIPFPMWIEHLKLAEALRRLVDDFSKVRHPQVALTMTGELADCFRSKQEGVAHICGASQIALPHSRTWYYQTTGQFVSASEAAKNWGYTAAANWHALTSYVARQFHQGILLDIGSTTTDIVPFANGQCASHSINDMNRLLNQELVYTGVARSPVCALVSRATVHGQPCQVAQEVFATTLDAYLVLRKIAPSSDNRCTADHRPATIAHACQRLSRNLCVDASELDHRTIEDFARSIANAQHSLIRNAVESVIARTSLPRQTFIISGEGHWLAKEIADSIPGTTRVSLLDEIYCNRNQKLAGAATAYALARLAAHHSASEATIETYH